MPSEESNEIRKLQQRLVKFTDQLEQIYTILESDPENSECLSLAKDLVEVIRLTKESRQKSDTCVVHQQEDPVKDSRPDIIDPGLEQAPTINILIGTDCEAKHQDTWYPVRVENVQEDTIQIQFFGFHTKDQINLTELRDISPVEHPITKQDVQIGMRCLARYYVDHQFYECVIAEETSLGVSVVFTGYGNTEEVPLSYLCEVKDEKVNQHEAGQDMQKLEPAPQAGFLVGNEAESKVAQSSDSTVCKPIKIPDHLQILPTDTEAEKERKRKRIRALKNLNRQKRLDNERNVKQQGWKAFQHKAKQKRVRGTSGALSIRGESIFASPETVDGRVGVVGSGLGMTMFPDTRKKCVITIGSSRQVIRVLFDTDSLYTWIPTQPSIYYSHFYKSELSATSHPLNRSFVSLFEDTMISGRLIKDILHLTPDVYIRSQTIGQVDQVPLADGVIPYDGVVGFGFDVLELGDAQTPMHALKQSNLLDENVFAFCLGPNGGELRIGEIDPTCYKPPIVFVPVYLSKQWSVRLTGIYVNDKLVVRDAYAYFASSENYISGPDDQVEKLAEQVGAYKFPFTDFYWLRCSKKVNLSFEIGGQLFTFTPDDYIRKVGPICIFMFRHISKMTGQDAWLFGDIFLRKVYTIFKYGNRNESEIGFALAT
ncbi:hypothetical protein ABG067_003790 [Albugo candida]